MKCKSCNTEIIWAVTTSGKKFRLEPSPEGLFYALPQAGIDGGLALDEPPLAIDMRVNTPAVESARDRGETRHRQHECGGGYQWRL